jgi:hypothetical protein
MEQETVDSQNNSKREKQVRGNTFAGFKLYCKAIGMKTV